MKLTKIEQKAFESAGAAICAAKQNSADKKDALKLLAAVMADPESRQELLAGITIGDYKFTIVQRDELTAIRV